MIVPMAWWFMAALGSASGAVFVIAYLLSAAPTPSATRLGIRGLKRARSLRTQSAWSAVEPLVRWLAGRIAPLLSAKQRSSLELQVRLAGERLGVTAEEYAAMSLLSGAAGLCVGAIASTVLNKGWVWAILACCVGTALPWLHFSGEAQTRSRRIQNGLPYIVDMLSLALSAGLDFPGALRQVLDKASDPNDALMEEIGYILQELLIGKTRKQALIEFGQRCPFESVIEFVSSVVQAEERGNPLAEVLHIQAGASRARRSVRAEEKAAKAGLQIIVPCLFVFISVVLLIVGPLFMALGPAFGG
jgi:tight adherence protein C